MAKKLNLLFLSLLISAFAFSQSAGTVVSGNAFAYKAEHHLFQKGNKLVLDFSQVAYVSSAGLRALLIGQKTANSKGGSMTLIHVPDAVNQVFQMSGFSGILTIE